MKKQITSISIFQSSKVLALLGFVFMALYCLPAVLYTLALGQHKEQSLAVTLAPLFVPVLYLVVSFFLYILLCFLYNLIAKFCGGVEFEVTDVE